MNEINILVVDNEEKILKQIEKKIKLTFKKEKIVIKKAHSKNEAQKIIDKESYFDIIITDIYMEYNSAGIDLVKNNLNKNISFIVCTAYSENFNEIRNLKTNEQINYLLKTTEGIKFLDHLSLIIENILKYKNKEFFLKLPKALQHKIIDDSRILDLKSVENVAICFIDIISSTKLGNTLSREESLFVDFLKEYYNVVLEKTNKYEGIVDKFMGDGALIHFGAYDEKPNAKENAEQCLKCVIEIINAYNIVFEKHYRIWRTKINDLEEKLPALPKLKASVNIGSLFRGIIQTNSDIHITILGDAVNYTSKMCDFIDNEPDLILVSDTCESNLEDSPFFTFEKWEKNGKKYHKLIR